VTQYDGALEYALQELEHLADSRLANAVSAQLVGEREADLR
jgi:hypothetical protein